MVTYARLETKSAPLSEEFGYNYATRLFGAEALTDLPTYTRGKNAGKVKAVLNWTKCTSGGWCRDRGRVVRPGLVRAWITTDEGSTLSGNWLGEVRTLAGDASLLGPQNREAELARRQASSEDIAPLLSNRG